MQGKLAGFSTVVMVFTGFGRVISASTPTIYPLGIASGNNVSSRPYGLNASGQVAVTSTQLFGQVTASRYDGTAPGGSLVSLGTLPGYQTSAAWGVNASGQVAGFAQGATVSTSSQAFRYDGTPGAGGIMRALGTLGGTDSQAYAINDLGQVTGYAQTDPNGPTPGQFAFVYTGTPGAGGIMKSLGSLGGTTSQGMGINNSGQDDGISEITPGGLVHAFRYDGPAGSGVMRDLGVTSGFPESLGNAINASGQVAGALESADFSHAFIYKGTPGIDGVMTDLGTLPGGTLSEGDAMNDAGFVVGISDESADSNLHFHPVLWRPDGSSVDLEGWLDATNPALGANWDLKDSFVTGINNAGQIVGDGIYSGPGPFNGHSVAYLLDASSLLPEPTAGAFLVGGMVLLLRRRK